MAKIVDGSMHEFRIMTYGRPSERTMSFLRDQYESPTSSLARASDAFRKRVSDMYETNYGEEALAKIDRIRRQLGSIWNLDEVRELHTPEEFQCAGSTLRRFLMANPTLRRLHRQGRIEGYGSLYQDPDPHSDGKYHYDWRQVMSGMVEVNEDPNAEYEWVATTYFDELLEGDVELTHIQKEIIRDNWARQEAMLLFGQDDLTSPSNNRWG